MESRLSIQIRERIDAHKFFKARDFSISFPKKEGHTELSIIYLSEPQYKFIASIPRKQSKVREPITPIFFGSPTTHEVLVYQVTASVSPGQLLSEQEEIYEDDKQLLDGIYAWLDRVQEYLLAGPLFRQMEEQENGRTRQMK